MEIYQFYWDGLKIFEDGRSVLQSRLAEVDRAIEQLRKENPENPALPMIEPGRVNLQAQINQLNLVIEEIQNLANGQPAVTGERGEQLKLRPGQYETVRRLKTAVHSLLLHYPGGGPITLNELANILNEAGASVQIRNGPRKGTRDKIRATHIKIMVNGDNTALRSKLQASPFIYDERNNTVRLKTPEAMERETAELKSGKKAKGRSSSGQERSSVTLPQVSVLSGSE